MHPPHPADIHHICALWTAQRFLIRALIEQGLHMRAGVYAASALVPVLYELKRLLRFSVCIKTATLNADEMPPGALTRLLNQLPPYMQVPLEQAIEAEKRGEATHECFPAPAASEIEAGVSWMRQELVEAAHGLPPQSGHPGGLG